MPDDFGPLNQCDHPDMVESQGHLYCPTCGIEWDEGWSGAEDAFWQDYMASKADWDELKAWNEK